MKTIKFLSVAIFASTVLFSCNKSGVTNKSINTQIDSVSYAIGMDVARNVATNVAEIDRELFIQGFLNVSDSATTLIEKEKVQKVLGDYFKKKQAELQKKQQEDAQKKAEEKFNDNKVAGENFLEENKEKEGVQTTASGLQYIVLKEGSGAKPSGPTTKVKVHYHGTAIDGTVFDSSVDRGKPSEFGLNQVIKGWTEGLQLMSVGAKYKFFIPQDLAYGVQQKGASIKPFSALVFEVELLEILN